MLSSYLVSMLFADLLSLHLNTFLTFFSLVDIIIVTALECIQHYPLQDRHHVILSSHAGCMARDLISIVSTHSFKPYIHMHHMLTHTHTLHTRLVPLPYGWTVL